MTPSFLKLLLLGIIITLALVSCTTNKQQRIFYLNSYHKGYAASDSIEAGLRRLLPTSAQVESFYLNAKQLSGVALDSMVLLALQAIRQFNPDAIIASDDDAVKRVIVPSFKNTAVPVVFCGVNWSAAEYGLPTENVTGMLEVLPLEKTIIFLQHYFPGAKKLVVLSERSTSEQKNQQVLDTFFRRLGLTPQYSLAGDFDEWKTAFLEANKNSDLVYLPTNGAIKNWQNDEAKLFVQANIQKPVFTCDDFMMPYAVLGFTKVAAEQGEWAANTVMQILAGTKPSSIPVAKNKAYDGWLNAVLAQKISWSPDEDDIQQLQIIQ